MTSGKEAVFRLAEEGRRALTDAGERQEAPPKETWWNALPHAIGIWDKDGCPVAANAAMRSFTNGNPSIPYADWVERLEVLAQDERRQADTAAREMLIGPSTWIRLCESSVDGNRIAAIEDISTFRREEEHLRQLLVSLQNDVAAFREKETAQHRKLLAYHTLVRSMQGSMVDLASSAHHQVIELAQAARLRGVAPDVLSMAALGEESLPGNRLLPAVTREALPPSTFVRMSERLHGLTLLLKNLANIPLPETDPDKLETVDLGKTIREIASIAEAFDGKTLEIDVHARDTEVEIHSSFKTVLSQILTVLCRPASTMHAGTALSRTQYHLKARGEREQVVVAVAPHVRQTMPRAFSYEKGSFFTATIVGSLPHADLSMCRILAEEHGCLLTFGEDDEADTVMLKYPIKPHRQPRMRSLRRGALKGP